LYSLRNLQISVIIRYFVVSITLQRKRKKYHFILHDLMKTALIPPLLLLFLIRQRYMVHMIFCMY